MVQPDTAHWNSFVHPFIYSFYQSLNKSSDCSARCWVYNKETRRYKTEWETGSKYTNFQRSVQLEIVIGTVTVKTWGDKRIMEETQEDGSQAAPFALPLSDELKWSERSQGKNTAGEGGAGWKGPGVIGAEAGRYRQPYIYVSPEDLEEGAEFCSLISYLDDQLHGINAQVRWCGQLDYPPLPIFCKELFMGQELPTSGKWCPVILPGPYPESGLRASKPSLKMRPCWAAKADWPVPTGTNQKV